MTSSESQPHFSERFWSKVDRGGDADCWSWLASKDRDGYGFFCVSKDRPDDRAYRVAYRLLVGPIPNGLELDHLCRNPGCVNPTHLEPVSHRVNVLRGQGPSAINARKTH